MKLLAATLLSFSLLATASAQTNPAGAASGSVAAPAASTQDSQAIKITRSGSQPSRQGPAENFTGSVRVDTPFQANAPARTSGALVTFQPGARSAWHSHPLGQTLIVTTGTGRVQRWGDPVDEIRQGDVVWIPPGQKHWHGASPNTAMSHIAIVEQLDGKSTEWMEKVTDAQYGAPVRAQGQAVPAPGARPRPSQGAIGDFAPKLAELTDDVLYGDVWERPQLSKRDRSLVTVSALIALNRPDQLRSHLARARENGVPRRGRAARSTQPISITATPDEQVWFGIFRLGAWPNFYPDVQFSREAEALNQFFRQMLPNTGPYDAQVNIEAVSALFDKMGPGVLVTHSQSGGPGWRTAIRNRNVRAVVSFEPGGDFPFPEGEAPPLITLGGREVRPPAVPLSEFMLLTKIPVVIYYGDNIREKPSANPGQEQWRAFLEVARKWRDAVNKRGGNVTLLHLPEIGIRGNTHFPMSDINNLTIADLLSKFLKEKNLD